MGLLFLPWLLIAWLILALACCSIARSKGLSVNGWGFLALLFGPFALAGVLLTSPDYTALERKEARTGEMRRCPHCDELIRKAAIKCRYCGLEIGPPEIYKPNPPLPEHSGLSGLIKGTLLEAGAWSAGAEERDDRKTAKQPPQQ